MKWFEKSMAQTSHETSWYTVINGFAPLHSNKHIRHHNIRLLKFNGSIRLGCLGGSAGTAFILSIPSIYELPVAVASFNKVKLHLLVDDGNLKLYFQC
jgi:hypothetical protein